MTDAPKQAELTFKPSGKNGTGYLTITVPGAAEWTHHVNIMDADARARAARLFAAARVSAPPRAEGESFERWEHRAEQAREFLFQQTLKQIEKRSEERRQEIAERELEELAARRLDQVQHEEFVPFPVHLLPDPLDRFVAQAAESLDCDPSFVAGPLLAAVAGCVGNLRRIALNDDDWTEPAVLWVVVIGGSSSGKSPAIKRCMAYLVKAEAAQIADHRRALRDHKRAMNDYAAAMAKWNKTGRDEGAEQPEEPEPLLCPELIADNYTMESLTKMLEANPRGIIIVNDEIAGFFKKFDAYRSGKGGDAERFLEMWNAGAMKVNRKNAECPITFIPHAAVSITGGIQPKALTSVLTRDMFENGMAARFLFVFPDKREPKDAEARVDPAVKSYMHDVFARLLALKWQREDEDGGRPEPTDIPLSPEAAKMFRAFRLQTRREQYLTADGDMEAAWGKLVSYAARLALAVHMVRYVTDDRVRKGAQHVDHAAMAAGIELAKWFGLEARRVYSFIRDPEDRRKDVALAAWVASKGGTVTVRDLMRRGRKYASPDAAKAALEAMVAAGQGTWGEEASPENGGKKTRPFILNKPAMTAPTTGGADSADAPTTAPNSLQTNNPSGPIVGAPKTGAPTSADDRFSKTPAKVQNQGSIVGASALSAPLAAGLAEFCPADDLTEGGKYASDAAEEPLAGPPAASAAVPTQNLNPNAPGGTN